jgi:hypothetical protein
MASNLIGRFYFKLTDSKNLIGEFSNNYKTCKKNYTESAVLKFRNPADGKFIGDYFSTWYEEKEHNCVLAELKIEQKYENIFSLTWRLVQDNGQTAADPSFWGEGILCDGILIGDYRDFENR